MLEWRRLRLFEDFFYGSQLTEENFEEIRFYGKEEIYFRVSEGEILLPKGQYVFLQKRNPLNESFLEENEKDLESFLLHKGINCNKEKAVFRTLKEDGQIAYQLWIPIKD